MKLNDDKNLDKKNKKKYKNIYRREKNEALIWLGSYSYISKKQYFVGALFFFVLSLFLIYNIQYILALFFFIVSLILCILPLITIYGKNASKYLQ